MAAVNPGGWGHDRDTCAARLRRVAYLTGLGWDTPAIAAELGVSTRTVTAYRARARTGWRPSIGAASDAYTPAVAERVAELYATGLTQAQVGERLGLTEGTVQRVMAAFALPARPKTLAARPGPRPAPASAARAVELYTGGWSTTRVAAEVGVSKDTVRRWLHRAGVQVRGRSEAMRLALAGRDAGLPGHGTRARCLRGCRCEPCVQARRAYARAWYAARRAAA